MKRYRVDIQKNKKNLLKLIVAVAKLINPPEDALYKVFKKYPSLDGKLFSKSALLIAYKKLVDAGEVKLPKDKLKNFLKNVRMKKVRTISGVTPVTVLTKPYPCPGNCLFCPIDTQMPKSYLKDEPGAQRALANNFDPYLQVHNRLVAFMNTGHPTDKVELLVLGGTWSFYPKDYQRWFIKRCFDALNDFNSELASFIDVDNYSYKEEIVSWEELFKAHTKNEKAQARCVGLVLETRPDHVTQEEVINLRKLGATKVQLGVQSLDDEVLQKNKRGHTVEETKNAFSLLRQAGFKIHIHYMPNLYGSDPKKDVTDFKKLFDDLAFRPDELKIYPCSLIKTAPLMDYFEKGLWKPYTEDELVFVLKGLLQYVPRYCRVTRVIRDISSDDIVAGNKKTNLRQIVEQDLEKEGVLLKDIRSREVKGLEVASDDLSLKITEYETLVSKEFFIEYVTSDEKIAGFLRLSLPLIESFVDELKGCAVIREVHVYGKSVEVGESEKGKAQHIGLGKSLIDKAKSLSLENGFSKLSVISAVGTRPYYAKLGFEKGDLYQSLPVK